LFESGMEFANPNCWQVTWQATCDFDLFRWCLLGLPITFVSAMS
jgi:hypothetical protein